MSSTLLPVLEGNDERGRRMTAAEWIDAQEFRAAREREAWERAWDDTPLSQQSIHAGSRRRRVRDW